MASTAMPQTADARPLILKMLRGVTAPLGAVMGAGRHSSRRATASRSRPAAVGVGAAGAAAAATAASPDTTAALAAGGATDGRATDPGQGSPVTRSQSHLGTVGPPAWPSAYEDVIGFTLWPREYGERVRIHGIGDVLSTALAPSASLAARARPNIQQARADQANTAPVPPACSGVDLTSTDWPMAQIAGAIELNDAQRGMLDQLKKALSDAVSSLKSACRDETNFTPVERLRSMQNALWAVHDAAQLIRTPLAAFYDSLTEDQKKTFAAPSAQQPEPRAIGRADAGRGEMSRETLARMCGSPASSDAAMRQIEQGLRPTKAQRASLEVLQKKSFEMGQFLMASCLKPMPATPAERLDAAADRLTAVIFAASNVNMALNDFTSQLSDEQKTKLNSLVR
jgi:hypothetical protein